MSTAADAPDGAPGLPPYAGFREASSAVLDRLRQQAPLGLWMVTRTWGDDWVILSTKGGGYDITDGTVLRWSDSFCSRMVRGEGPRIAPRTAEVPAYAASLESLLGPGALANLVAQLEPLAEPMNALARRLFARWLGCVVGLPAATGAASA